MGITQRCGQTVRKETITMAQARVPVTMRDFFFDDPFFKNSWEDFDKVRSAMLTESRDMWKKFDEDFRENACMNNNIMLEAPTENKDESRALARQDSKARWEDGWMFPRKWMLPSLQAPLKDLDLFKSKDSEVIRVKEDESKLEVTVEGGVGVVCVEGRHEEKAEDGSKMVARSFSRRYTLPQGASGEKVVSNLSSDGVLVITAPKNNLAIK